MKIKQYPFYLIAAAIFLGITGPALFSDGMFIDGLLYAGVARNLSENLGSFWDMHMTNTLYPHFHGHPPLAFGIQSLFFRVLGDSIYVERVYSLLTYIITGWVITRIWFRVTDKKDHSLAWLPLLFWVIIPLVTWASANNMLENTLMIFTSLSVLFLLKSLESRRFLNLAAAGCMIFLALLTKGLVALFPLSFLFWVLVIKRDFSWRRFLIDTTIILSALLLPLLLIFIIQAESLEFIKAYYKEQLVKSMGIETVNSRFYILWRLFKELIPVAGLLLLVFLSAYRRKVAQHNSNWIYVFLALGLSGVLPIMVSMKQSGFYMLPAFPFFSMAAAILILPHIRSLSGKINIKGIGYKILKVTGVALLTAGIIISFSQVNKIGRDRKMITDVKIMINLIPEHATISVQNEIWTHWYLHGYFNRYANISLEEVKKNKHKYMLVSKDFNGEMLSDYKIIDQHLLLYDLYERKGNDSDPD